ncbi:TRAPP complex subunit 6A [Intoshia linei]|uniref:U6 snRNA-associated Sm-like protein LSm8 n=1 Tax=Intoshia linei TaxID=1819745 RepID=A0A177AX91_9BILA|nr:TRAPP complex subunit 6A [Intoshia linei]
MATCLEELVSKTVSIITADGRYLIGKLRGYDQLVNIILDETYERVFSSNSVMEKVALGLYLIRGDNIAVIGEIDEAVDRSINYENLRCEPLNHITDNSFDCNLTAFGEKVGAVLVEKAVERLPRFANVSDMVCFISEDFWIDLYGKNVTLLTGQNEEHFQLKDSSFLPVINISNGPQFKYEIHKYASFTCGIIQGALKMLGVNSYVTFITDNPPCCII